MSSHINNFFNNIIESEFSTLSLNYEPEFEDLEDNSPDRHIFPRLPGSQRLDFKAIPDRKSRANFRFTYLELVRITKAMGLDGRVAIRSDDDSSKHVFHVSGLEGLAIVLARLARPNSYEQLESIFGMGTSELGHTYNTILVMLFCKYENGLIFNRLHFHPLNLKLFNEAIKRRGSCYPDCVGFIDGSKIDIARPTRDQELNYSGHYKKHVMRFQVIVTPDGITASLYGLYYGSIHDTKITDIGDVKVQLREALHHDPRGEHQYHLYGDEGYVRSGLIARPFSEFDVARNPIYYLANEIMKPLRVVVEWEIGHVKTLFASFNLEGRNKLLLTRIGMELPIATLFKNIQLCLKRRNETSKRFGIDAPVMEEYLIRLECDNEIEAKARIASLI